ncbi:MAG TPA: sigma-54-dependent Fis family transcriptional regulator [Kofleriaceae bacterium]|nr:sigma-54-dependent Fis family transcriptional regulator [Kofleriaceae bacterium]
MKHASLVAFEKHAHSNAPRAVAELHQHVIACQNLGDLLSVLADGLGEVLPVTDRVSVVFLEPDGEWMRIYRVLPACGPPKGALPRVRVDGTPVGQVVKDGVGRLVADTRTDPNITFGHASHDGIRSTISVPIRTGGCVVGAINAGSFSPGACDQAMLRQVEDIAKVVGPAIHDAEQLFARAPVSLPVPAGERLVGKSAAFRSLMAAGRRAAEADVDVLITGETGVGKTAIARAMHEWSRRRHGPFVTVHLADLSSSIIESELFGHERGAFTGAHAARRGRFESARGGTIFLDEVGEAPRAIQAKVLRVIQDRCFERVGGSQTLRADVRIIAATSRDLALAMARGEFREDLFYRLNVVPLHVPPLRDRREDLELLVASILDRLRAADGRARRLSREAWKRLRAHGWPGNVRELESVLRRAAILEDASELCLDGLGDGTQTGAEPTDEWPTLDDHQRQYIQRVLAHCHGVIEGAGGAARLLGVCPSTLRSKMARLGISRGGQGRSSCEP